MIWPLFLGVGLVIVLLRKLTAPSDAQNMTLSATGVIVDRYYKESYMYFCVRFRDVDGVEHVGKSVYYQSSNGKYLIGDSAPIRYFFTPKGRARVVIDDPQLISSEMGVEPSRKGMLVIEIFCFVLAAITFFVQVIL